MSTHTIDWLKVWVKFFGTKPTKPTKKTNKNKLKTSKI
jgi:hypothetical protein